MVKTKKKVINHLYFFKYEKKRVVRQRNIFLCQVHLKLIYFQNFTLYYLARKKQLYGTAVIFILFYSDRFTFTLFVY